MHPLADYPPVLEALLDKVVERILEVGKPDKIVLFGSRARGDWTAQSDLDLLIIKSSQLPRSKRGVRYRLALRHVFPAKDIIVRTPEEIETWCDVPGAFVTTILNEGKVLYER